MTEEIKVKFNHYYGKELYEELKADAFNRLNELKELSPAEVLNFEVNHYLPELYTEFDGYHCYFSESDNYRIDYILGINDDDVKEVLIRITDKTEEGIEEMKKEIMYQLIQLNEQKRKEQNITLNKYSRKINLSQSTYYNLVHKNIQLKNTETKTFLRLLSQLEYKDMLKYISKLTT